jgi:hypothetical protein
VICGDNNRRRTAESKPVRGVPFAIKRLHFCP